MDFFPPMGYKKRTYQNPANNNRIKKMGVTEEGSMSDEKKKKAELPDIKVRGLFCFGKGIHLIYFSYFI